MYKNIAVNTDRNRSLLFGEIKAKQIGGGGIDQSRSNTRQICKDITSSYKDEPGYQP